MWLTEDQTMTSVSFADGRLAEHRPTTGLLRHWVTAGSAGVGLSGQQTYDVRGAATVVVLRLAAMVMTIDKQERNSLIIVLQVVPSQSKSTYLVALARHAFQSELALHKT